MMLSYLAGLFDGEGCVSITTHKKKDKIYYTKTLIFTQSEESSCLLFQSELGVGKIYKRDNRVNKIIYDWRANNRDAIIAAQLLFPYVRVKKEELLIKILIT